MTVTRSHDGQTMQVLGDRVTIKLPSDQSPHGQQRARFLAWTAGGPMGRFFVKMAEHGVERVA